MTFKKIIPVLCLALSLPFLVGTSSSTRQLQGAVIKNGSGTVSVNSSGTVTLPNATDTLVGKATTDTLTNKTIDANGTGNSISNIENADIAAAAAIARTKIASGTASHVVTNDGSGVLSSEANLAVSRGGTGAGTLTANNVILGNGTSAVQFVAPGSSGNVLTSNGTTWTSAATSAPSAASQSDQETGTSTTTYVSPGRQQYHQSAAKAWVQFDGTGTPAINGSYNVSSITDNGTGDYSINFTTAFSNPDYAAVGMAIGSGANAVIVTEQYNSPSRTTGDLRIYTLNATGSTTVDVTEVSVVFFGDQ